MKEIEVEQYGYVHYYAQCNHCSWDMGISRNGATKADVRNLTRAHVRKTGHTVIIGAGKETKYSPKL